MPTATTRTIADRMNSARRSLGMTVEEVATAAQVPYGTVWNWESGRCIPARDSEAFGRVVKALNLPKVTMKAAR